jgi:plasmid stability protein
MPQLVVSGIEEEIVKRLKLQAARHGCSLEEQHRRILRRALPPPSVKRPSFKQALLAVPNVGPDELFERRRDMGRAVEL